MQNGQTALHICCSRGHLKLAVFYIAVELNAQQNNVNPLNDYSNKRAFILLTWLAPLVMFA